MVEIDWWKRPSANEMLHVLQYISGDTSRVYVVVGQPGIIRQPLGLSEDSESWDKIRWQRWWYVVHLDHSLT